MRIGQLARRTGFAESQIRYYERRGLLPPPARSESGYRIYGEPDVARLRLLRRAKLLGLPLVQAGELLAAAESGCCDETERAARDALERRIAEVDRQIDELRELRATLADALSTQDWERAVSTEGCGSEFCLPANGGEPAGVAQTARLPELMLPVVSAGGCCEPDCGPETCG